MSQQNGSKVTIANILSVVCLLVLGVLICFGELFMTEGNVGTSLLWSLGFVIIAAALVFGASSLKNSRKDASLMLGIQIVLLILYVAAAAFMFRPISHFVNIQFNKSDYQNTANEDIDQVEQLFWEYERYETEAITRTRTGLSTAISGIPCEMPVLTFMESQAIRVGSSESEEKFVELQREILLTGNGGGSYQSYEAYKNENKLKIDEWKNVVRNWNLMTITMLPKKMKAETLGPAGIIRWLEDRSAMASLPVISSTDGSCDIEEENQVIELSLPSFELAEALSTPQGFNWIACVICVILNLLVLLTYFSTTREHGFSYSSKKKNTSTGGQVL